jgi:phospholipid N-methyltransferase
MMRKRIAEYGVFFGEFVRNFETTGAVLPSGPWLASALVRFVDQADAPPRRILEIGPGTGAVTRRLVAALRPEDRLDLVELNGAFVRTLNHRFATEHAFQAVAARSRVFHCALEDLPRDTPYDLIISGLPLNNFSAGQVKRILRTIGELGRPGGTLSFFEYIAVRTARAMVSGRSERLRLRGISHVLSKLLDGREIRRDWIWPNIPPAWVHHVRM